MTAPAPTPNRTVGEARLLVAIMWPPPFEQLIRHCYAYADRKDGSARARIAIRAARLAGRMNRAVERRRAVRALLDPSLLDLCTCVHARGAHPRQFGVSDPCTAHGCRCRLFIRRPPRRGRGVT